MNDQAPRTPDFIIIGSMKSGTTTLYDDLNKLPDLHLPSDKEPACLLKGENIRQIRSAYEFHFRKAKPGQLCGEASTDYTKLPIKKNVATIAAAVCGKKLKLIMVIRDPIDRIYSHLRHDLAEGKISPDDLDNTVLSCGEYVAVSDYALQIKPWIEVFGQQNLLCIDFSRYTNSRLKTVQQIAEFLGIDCHISEADLLSVKNDSSGLRKMSPIWGWLTRQYVYRRYLRPLLSDGLRTYLTRLGSKKTHIPDFQLEEDTVKILKQRLSHLEVELPKLTGTSISFAAALSEHSHRA